MPPYPNLRDISSRELPSSRSAAGAGGDILGANSFWYLPSSRTMPLVRDGGGPSTPHHGGQDPRLDRDERLD